MRKAGIVTYFGENYGACLQAYAVQETVRKFGFDTEIINYLPGYKTSKLQFYLRKLKYLLNLKEYIQNKKIMMKYSDQQLNRSKKFNNFVNNYLTLTSKKYYSVSELINEKLDYDVYITGSDQLWNPTHHKCNRVYFLDFVPEGKKRVAFAPSIARREIPDKYKTEMARLLSKMDYISVREDINVNTVKELVPHKEVEHILDPTFMLNANEWDEIIADPIYKEPYIFCYLFGDLVYIGEFVEYIKEKTGYRIVSMPYNIRELENKDTEKIFDAGPLEFVNLIKNAAIIITDSFHATAFSINYQKPFYTLLRQEEDNPDNMNSRFFSILKLVGLEERLILPGSKYPSIDNMKIDYEKPMEKLELARKKTNDYLKRSLA